MGTPPAGPPNHCAHDLEYKDLMNRVSCEQGWLCHMKGQGGFSWKTGQLAWAGVVCSVQQSTPYSTSLWLILKPVMCNLNAYQTHCSWSKQVLLFCKDFHLIPLEPCMASCKHLINKNRSLPTQILIQVLVLADNSHE